MIFYIICFVVQYSIIFVGNMYYRLIYCQKIKSISLYVIQMILLVLFFMFRKDFSLISSLIIYIIYFLPLLYYQDSLKKKLFYYMIVYFLLLYGEIAMSALFMMLSVIFDYGEWFIADFYNHQSIVYIAMIVCTLFLDGITFSIINKYKFLKEFHNSMFYLMGAFVISITGMNMLYGVTKITFVEMSLVYMIIALLSIFLAMTAIRRINRDREINRFNCHQQKILEMQLKNIQIMDDQYRYIRRRNHDLKNHYLIMEQLFHEDENDVIDYIDEFLRKYQEELTI